MRLDRPLLVALGLAIVGCGAEPTSVPIDVMTGKETDTFTADPKVTRVDIAVTSLDGSISLKASAEPGGTFDLGEVPEDQQISIDVSGVSEDGTVVVQGRSLGGILLSGVEGAIPVFAQRTNQWARPSGGLPHAHVGGAAGVVAERFLLLSGGSAAAGPDGESDVNGGDFYDMLGWGASTGDTFARAPQSIVSIGTTTVLIGENGATRLDFAYETTEDLDAPTGMNGFGEVAGGAVIAASEGRSFVVGATRRGAPTRAVLEVGSDGATLAAYTLIRARSGAAAAWLDGVGLVVAGGSAEGAGVELLAVGGTSFVERDYAPDATEGAGAVIDPPGAIALIGGTIGGAPAATRRLDPTCLGTCAPTVVDAATLPVALTDVAVFALGGARAIAIGNEAIPMGLTRTFLVELGGAVIEVPLREPRRGATAIPAPNATLALLGGEHPDGTPALSVEMFFPR